MNYLTPYIAIYGAIVGTFALVLNFLRYKQKDVKLKISYQKEKDFEKNIEDFGKGYDPETSMGGSNCAKIYEVIIQNTGSVNAYIKEVFMEGKNKIKYPALVNNQMILIDVPKANLDPIAPKSAKTFSIYLFDKNNIGEMKSVHVVDETGKEWKVTVKNNNEGQAELQ